MAPLPKWIRRARNSLGRRAVLWSEKRRKALDAKAKQKQNYVNVTAEYQERLLKKNGKELISLIESANPDQLREFVKVVPMFPYKTRIRILAKKGPIDKARIIKQIRHGILREQNEARYSRARVERVERRHTKGWIGKVLAWLEK